MRKVILESPFAGDVEKNIRYARACVRDCVMKGDAPIASHLLYTQPGILDDTIPEERQLGIDSGLAWGSEAAATVVYVDLGISNGMKYGIARAEKENRPVEKRSIGFSWIYDPKYYSTINNVQIDIIDKIYEEIKYQKEHYSDVHDSKHSLQDWITIITMQLGKAAIYSWHDKDRFIEYLIKIAAVSISAIKSLKEK